MFAGRKDVLVNTPTLTAQSPNQMSDKGVAQSCNHAGFWAQVQAVSQRLMIHCRL